MIDSFFRINSENYITYDKNSRDISIKLDSNNNDGISKIAELIIFILKENKLKEYIWSSYKKLDDTAKEKVYLEAKSLLEKKDEFILKTIYDKIYEFIEKDDFRDDFINIDGFFRFRMNDFKVYISIISDIALEEYLIKRDKDQFLTTIKYFIESQNNKIDVLVIHITRDAKFRFYNKFGDEINSSDDMMSMFIKEDLNYEDFLISIILTLCPKEIEIIDDLKNKISKDIIENIKIIFEDNVKIVFKH